jgi:hypothetical protein
MDAVNARRAAMDFAADWLSESGARDGVIFDDRC